MEADGTSFGGALDAKGRGGVGKTERPSLFPEFLTHLRKSQILSRAVSLQNYLLCTRNRGLMLIIGRG